MSSILKALKKLENESPSSVYDHSWLKEIDEKGAGLDRLAEHWRRHRPMFATGVVVLLAFLAAMAVNLKFGFRKTTPVPQISEKKPSEAVKPVPPKASTVQLPPNSVSKREIKQKSFEIQPKEISPLPTVRHARGKSADVPNGKRSEKAANQAIETSAAVSRQAAKPTAKAKSSTARPDFGSVGNIRAAEDNSTLQPAEPSVPDQRIDAVILDHPGVRLQAISWSENAQKRLAVINSKIVHQGERVGTYIVIQINEDDVILREGKERRKLIFRPR